MTFSRCVCVAFVAVLVQHAIFESSMAMPSFSPTAMPTFCNDESIGDDTLATGEDIIPSDAYDYLELFDFYDYCRINNDVEWKRGVKDGTLTESDLDSAVGDSYDEIDYNLFFCLFGIYKKGYILINSTDGTVLDSDSGVTIGGGIDLGTLGYDDVRELKNVSNSTLDALNPYFRLRGEEALEALCEYGQLILTLNESYSLTLNIVENICMESVSERYDTVAVGINNTWSKLTKGVKTVLTVMYCIHGNDLYDYIFWQEMINKDYESAIISLSTWSSLLGYTDKELYQYLANILSASIECRSAVDVVFLIDGSQSVSDQSFERVKKFIKRIIRNYKNLEETQSQLQVRFGVSQFSTYYENEFYLKEFAANANGNETTNITIYEAIDNIEKQNGLTRLGVAMEQLASDQFNISSGMRDDGLYIPRVAIIITDGYSSDGVNRDALDELDVNIIGVGVGDYDPEQLEEIGDSVYEIGSFDNLTSVINDIIGDTCLAGNEIDIGDGNGDGDGSDDININPFHCHYYHFKRWLRRAFGGDSDSRIRFNLHINQNKGCVYVYVSVCTQYPSYYNNIISHKICGQKNKTIVINSIDNSTWTPYCGSNLTESTWTTGTDSGSGSSSDSSDRRRRRSMLLSSRNLLGNGNSDIDDESTVYITVEGIDADSNYTILLEECLSNETECKQIGSNEDSGLTEGRSCRFDSDTYDEDEYFEEKDECLSKTNERDCVGYFDFCLWDDSTLKTGNNDNDDLEAGEIIGIVFSCLICVGIVIVVVIIAGRKIKEQKESGISSVSADIVNRYQKGQTNIMKQKSTDR